MSENTIRRASLAEIRKMRDTGELHHGSEALPAPSLGEDFWKDAVLQEPKAVTSVHLKLDSDVFDFFKQAGKGHLTRMQNVLKAYVNAQRGRTG